MQRKEVVGFDARELWLDIDSQWTDSQRNKYLLKSEKTKPLSVDNYVWYSIFSETSTPRIWQNISRRQVYRTGEWENTFQDSRQLTLPDIYRPRRIWTSLPSLKQYIENIWGNDWKPCAIIAVEEVILDDEIESEAIDIEPNTISEDWTLLGYDVADYELYSGLHDSEIDSALLKQIKSEWLVGLNEYHLFRDSDMAFDYIEFANLRNPSHQPFYVYGLYLVELKRAASIS